MVPLISLQNSGQPWRRRPGISLGQDVRLASCSVSLRFLQNNPPSAPCWAWAGLHVTLADSRWWRCVQFANRYYMTLRFHSVPQQVWLGKLLLFKISFGDMFIDFREIGSREGQKEKHRCESGTSLNWLLYTTYWGWNPQPRYAPWLGIKLATDAPIKRAKADMENFFM